MKNPLRGYDIAGAKRLIALLKAEKPGYIARILVFCAAEAVGTPLVALSTRQAVNAFASGGWAAFAAACMWKLLSHVIWMLAAPVERRSSVARSHRAVSAARGDAVEAALRADQRALDARSQGDTLSALSAEADKARDLLQSDCFEVARSAVGGTVGFLLMAAMDWRFTLIVLAVSALSVWTSARYGERLRAAGESVGNRAADTGADALELLRACEAVRLSGAREARRERFVASARAEAEARRHSDNLAARMRLFEAALGGVSWLAVLFGGMLLVDRGLADIGTVAALLGLRYIADVLIVECGQHLARMQTNLAGFRRLEEVMGLPREEERAPLPDNGGLSALSVRNVSFSYAPGARALRAFSMELPKTGLTLLTGPSGCGKTTVCRLLLGLYAPDEGQIAIPGGCASLRERRARIAYVPQEPMLLRGTILENILMGREGASREEAIAAARDAGLAEDLAKMPEGMDTALDDAGGALSGGQKQRVAIARALVRGAPILLLDEITSALDEASERAVLTTVKALSRSRAVLLVSHRPLSEAFADSAVRMAPPTEM